MAKIITIKVEDTTTQTEVQEVFTHNEGSYPVEIEEFLIDHVGERPSREERRG